MLTDQYRLQFRRTHQVPDAKNPEESLVDILAGEFGFWRLLVEQRVKGEISFDAIETARNQLCPEASRQSALIGFVKAWPSPCILVSVGLALKKSEEQIQDQLTFEFSDKPTPQLRAVRVTLNEGAKRLGINIFRNMRIPERSIIQRVFSEGTPYGEALENLEWWESSDGGSLCKCEVRVEARTARDGIDALIIPILDDNSGDVPAAVEFGRVAAAPVNTLRQQTHRCQEISVCF